MTAQPLPVETVDTAQSATARQNRLAAATARLRTKSGPREVDRMLAVAGTVLVPLGAALVLLGWFGTSRTTRVWEQLPYVVSGGLLGVGLMIAGGMSYLAAWLTRLVDESRQQGARAQDAVEQMAASLARLEGLLERLAPGVEASTDAPDLVATPAGGMIHLRECPIVADKPALRAVAADEPGMRPCMVCNPPVQASANGSRAGSRARR